MTNPSKWDGEALPSDDKARLIPVKYAPLTEALRRHRKSFEIEDATLVEMAALLDELKRKYRHELGRRIEDKRLLQSSIQVAELHQAYLRQEADVIGRHIGNVFRLHQQASHELRNFRRWIQKLYPGWSRVFDEASRRAADDNSEKK